MKFCRDGLSEIPDMNVMRLRRCAGLLMLTAEFIELLRAPQTEDGLTFPTSDGGVVDVGPTR